MAANYESLEALSTNAVLVMMALAIGATVVGAVGRRGMAFGSQPFADETLVLALRLAAAEGTQIVELAGEFDNRLARCLVFAVTREALGELWHDANPFVEWGKGVYTPLALGKRAALPTIGR
jgi:hypothetical protein